MKKTIVAAAIALASLSAAAQDVKTLKFGLNAGATFAGLRGNSAAESNDYALDYLVGASFELPLTKRLSLLANLNYERKSVTNTIPLSSVDLDPVVGIYTNADIRLTLQYLSLPVNVKYYVVPSKTLYVNGGVFAGYYLGDIEKVNNKKVKDDSQDIVKNMDFGVNLGIGTRIAINAGNDLNIELRDNLGLINISKVPIIDNGTVKTNSLNLILQWQFKL